MKLIIFWDAYPEKLSEILRLIKANDEMWTPPEGLEIIEEYVTPDGRFIQIVEASNEAAITKYLYVVGIKSGLCKSIRVSPVMLLEDWIKAL